MLDFLYPTSYFISLSGLILWFFFKENRKVGGLMQKIFFGSLLVYLPALLLSPGLFSVKLFALFRDLLTMGIIAKFFSFFKDSKLTFFVMLMVLFGAFQFKGKSYLQSTFDVAPSFTINDIDQNGELLIQIQEGESITAIASILSKYNLSHTLAFHPVKGSSTDLDDYHMIDIPDEYFSKILEIMDALKSAKVVEQVELNEVFKINPILSRKTPPGKIDFGINDPNVNKLWGFDAMRMDKLYTFLNKEGIKPKKKTKVFIVDSGIDANHEDLKGRYRSVNKEYDKDTNGHGTHCAGIAAAITNNGIGVASAFPSDDFAEVTGVKVMNFMGLITQQRLIEGIIEAIDNGADVISVSIGGPSREAAQEAFQEVVEYAAKANAIIVVAAGNSNLNATGFTPANADGVITVSALDSVINRASFSNLVGDLKMGIAAPGVDIYSTFPGSQYKALSGTSMACPYVSGLVGLMKSLNPDLTTQEVYDILKETGKKTGSTTDTGRMILPELAVRKVLGK